MPKAVKLGCGTGVAMLLVLSGCARPTPGPLASLEQLQQAGLSRHWSGRLPLPANDEVREAHLVDDQLYVLTKLGYVLAVRPDMGMVRWAVSLCRPVDKIFPPTHLETPDGEGPVAFVTSDKLAIYDRYTGDLICQYTLEFTPTSGASGDGQRVYIGAKDFSVYALLWHSAFARPIQDWRVQLHATLASEPVFDGPRRLVLPTRDGRVYACTALQKVGLWQHTCDGPVRCRPHVDESGVYVASLDRSVYHLDGDNGATLWRCRLPEPLEEQPVVSGNALYQYSNREGVFAIGLERGDILWHSPGGRQFVSRTDKTVCLLTAYRQLQFLDARDGKEMYLIDVPGADLAVSNPTDSAVYLLARDGRALCAQPRDLPYLRGEQAVAARESLLVHPTAERGRLRQRELPSEPREDPPTDPLASSDNTAPVRR